LKFVYDGETMLKQTCIHLLWLVPLIVAVSLSTLKVGADDAGPSTQLQVDRANIDFGKIPKQDSLEHTFKLRNSSSSPIIISDCNSSCGCLTMASSIVGKEFAIGETFELPVKMNLKRRRGNFNSVITLSYQLKNRGGNHEIGLSLFGELQGVMQIQPKEIDFGELSGPSSKSLEVVRVDGKSISTLEGNLNRNDHFSVSMTKNEGNVATFEIKCHPSESFQGGQLNSSLRLVLGDVEGASAYEYVELKAKYSPRFSTSRSGLLISDSGKTKDSCQFQGMESIDDVSVTVSDNLKKLVVADLNPNGTLSVSLLPAGERAEENQDSRNFLRGEVLVEYRYKDNKKRNKTSVTVIIKFSTGTN